MTIWSGRKPYRTHTQDMAWSEELAILAIDEQQEIKEVKGVLSCLLGGGMFISSYLPSLRKSGRGNILAGIGAILVAEGVKRYCSALCSRENSHMKETDTNYVGRRKVHTDQAIKIQQSIVVERPASELFQFWRNFENLPSILTHLHSVQVLNDQLSHWSIESVPGGPMIEWDAKVINEVPNERIGWSTLQGSDIDNAGSVQFESMSDGRSTRITVTLQYVPPAGRLGLVIIHLLGHDPKLKIAEDLQHFKERMDAPLLNQRKGR